MTGYTAHIGDHDRFWVDEVVTDSIEARADTVYINDNLRVYEDADVDTISYVKSQVHTDTVLNRLDDKVYVDDYFRVARGSEANGDLELNEPSANTFRIINNSCTPYGYTSD